MSDATESIRRSRIAEISMSPGDRQSLEATYGQVWSTQELLDEFDVVGFLAP
jgi:hypothetical protein